MANINIRIDDNIKKSAESIFAKLGMTPTTAIVLFYNQVIRTSGIPFELKVDVPNETTLKAIKEADDMENNPNAKTFASADELLEDILKWRMAYAKQVNLKKI